MSCVLITVLCRLQIYVTWRSGKVCDLVLMHGSASQPKSCIFKCHYKFLASPSLQSYISLQRCLVWQFRPQWSSRKTRRPLDSVSFILYCIVFVARNCVVSITCIDDRIDRNTWYPVLCTRWMKTIETKTGVRVGGVGRQGWEWGRGKTGVRGGSWEDTGESGGVGRHGWEWGRGKTRVRVGVWEGNIGW